MSIVDEIHALMRPEITDSEHDVSAADVSAAVCRLLAEIVLADDDEGG